MTTRLSRTRAVAYSIPFDFNTLAAQSPVPWRSLIARAVDALGKANERRAASEVARFIERNGGGLTDDLEREISQRFGSPVE
jgi:hypothetical protein